MHFSANVLPRRRARRVLPADIVGPIRSPATVIPTPVQARLRRWILPNGTVRECPSRPRWRVSASRSPTWELPDDPLNSGCAERGDVTVSTSGHTSCVPQAMSTLVVRGGPESGDGPGGRAVTAERFPSARPARRTLMSVAGLGLVLWGIIEGPNQGWLSPEDRRSANSRAVGDRRVRCLGTSRRPPHAAAGFVPIETPERGRRLRRARCICAFRKPVCPDPVPPVLPRLHHAWCRHPDLAHRRDARGRRFGLAATGEGVRHEVESRQRRCS